jgi:hypothetical protein
MAYAVLHDELEHATAHSTQALRAAVIAVLLTRSLLYSNEGHQ